MRRKCTPFYELEVATIYLRKSVSFFSPSQNDYSEENSLHFDFSISVLRILSKENALSF